MWRVFSRLFHTSLLTFLSGPQHDETSKMTRAPSKDSDHLAHSPSQKIWVLNCPRLWSDCADAKADQSHRWTHRLFCWFRRAAAYYQIYDHCYCTKYHSWADEKQFIGFSLVVKWSEYCVVFPFIIVIAVTLWLNFNPVEKWPHGNFFNRWMCHFNGPDRSLMKCPSLKSDHQINRNPDSKHSGHISTMKFNINSVSYNRKSEYKIMDICCSLDWMLFQKKRCCP